MDVLMPQLGETVSEGKVLTWFKSVGDQVKAGENLFEIETDKVTMEIQSLESGVLSEIRVPVGEVAPVGAVVAVIGNGAGASAAPSPAAAAKAPAAPPPAAPKAPMSASAPAAPPPAPRAPSGPLDPYFEVRTPSKNYGPATTGNGAKVTPLARRLAAESGVSLAAVLGSGPHGRIVAADIKTAPRAAAHAPAGPSSAEILALYKDVPHEEVPLDNMRRIIAGRLQQASQTIPHFYLTADVDIGALLQLREDLNSTAPRDKDGTAAYKFSVNDLIIKAWAAALLAVPAANAVWAEDRILRFSHADIAVAVALEGGLITPVVRDADSKSLRAVSSEMKDLAARARSRHLKPEEYRGGSSAISNLGMYGVREFSAIINPPHGTILAVGASRRQAVETSDGGVAFASLMAATLSCDHRVVDGALGAELLAAFREIVEAPARILI
jgi:pyruvate dehydrogenase E2 component (dihydrolipoamide acetyltransferase)